jgi:inner membrane transporter RhtA
MRHNSQPVPAERVADPPGPSRRGAASRKGGLPARVGSAPPQAFFLVSAVFHYLGPALAVLLFARVPVLGVAWLRIITAGLVFGVWRRPWRLVFQLDPAGRRLLLALGVVLAAMNSLFYLAVDRLPLSTVGAIEFLGTVILAAAGARTRRNATALFLTTAGVATITEIRLGGHPLGFAFAFANCGLFMCYVILGHQIANADSGHPASTGSQSSESSTDSHSGGEASGNGSGMTMGGIDRLGAAMLIAAIVATPAGLRPALGAFAHPMLLLAGAGVGVCSSVIPYVTDQLAMARMPRATFALMLALLPMFATVIGAIVLHQVPTLADLAGICLVIAGVALHHG